MHLLCTLAWSLILLPLGSCCESQKSKEDIAMGYFHIIQIRMESILNEIVNELNGTCRPANRSGNTSELPNVTIQFLNHVVCKHSPTNFCHMSPKVEQLTGEIHASLGCSCKAQHSTQKKSHCQPQLRLRKKLCTLKHWLERIKDLYSQFNST